MARRFAGHACILLPCLYPGRSCALSRWRFLLRAARAWQDRGMTESFPRQQARTRQFTLGLPRSFQISPDGSRVAFLRSRGGDDPVNCLWVLDARTGREHLAADPAVLGDAAIGLTRQEKARRERVREQAAGIVAFATDAALTMATFVLAGQVYV